MKKLMCLITVLTLVLSIPNVALGASPSEDAFDTVVDFKGGVNYILRNGRNNVIDRSGWVNNDLEYWYDEFNPYSKIQLEVTFDFTDQINEYIHFISSADNVWISFLWSCDAWFEPSGGEGTWTASTNYVVGGNSMMGGDYSEDYGSYPFDGELFESCTVDPVNYYNGFRNVPTIDWFDFTLSFELPCYGVDYGAVDISFYSFAMVLYMDGVDNQTGDMTIVINNGVKNVEKAVDDVKAEIKVMQGQLDSMIKPSPDDSNKADEFGSGMSDKVEQGGSILEGMGQMQKPDIDSVIGDNILSDNEADSMTILMDTVQPVLGSALFGRTVLISLILALVAYIFYGKR